MASKILGTWGPPSPTRWGPPPPRVVPFESYPEIVVEVFGHVGDPPPLRVGDPPSPARGGPLPYIRKAGAFLAQI